MSDHSNKISKGDDYTESPPEALSRFRSAASIAMTPELFEKLYLSPQNRVTGDLRKTFANPTPMCASPGNHFICRFTFNLYFNLKYIVPSPVSFSA